MAADRSRGRTAPPRALWLSAAWTGIGTAVLCALVAIVVVSICWLPAAGPAGNAGSAIHAGLLAFLTALHGGSTIDGLDTGFVPLGMTLAVMAVSWWSGRRLADAAAQFEAPRLRQSLIVQVVAFAAACALVAAVATLGTSSVSPLAAGVAGAVLYALTGGIVFARATGLTAELTERGPDWLTPAARAAAGGIAVYLLAGCVLVAGSLVVHHERVETLSSQVGGGWSGVPVLLLGLLAAPNAAIAGAGYLAGPGFAVGAGTTVGLTSSTHGTVPAFPLLGALPSGPANPLVWVLAVATPVLAGAAVAAIARGWREIAAGSAGAGLLGVALAWLGGGAIGAGRLSAVGASPWQLALVVAFGAGVVACVVHGVRTVAALLRDEPDDAPAPLRRLMEVVTAGGDETDDADETDETDDGSDTGGAGQLAG